MAASKNWVTCDWAPSSLPDGGAPVVVTSTADRPKHLALNDTHVFFLHPLSAQVWRAPKTGGPAEWVPGTGWQLGDGTSLAVDGDSVYWAVSESVMRMALGSTNEQVLISGLIGALVIAIDATYLYVGEWGAGRILRVVKTGGPVESLASGNWHPAAIAVDGDGVYWSTSDGTAMSVPLSGGTPVTLGACGGPLAADATSVYCNAGTGLARISKSGGPLQVLAAGAFAAALATDGAFVYFCTTKVERVPVGGGPVTTIAEVPSPESVVLDATGVYWSTVGPEINGMCGHVMMAAK